MAAKIIPDSIRDVLDYDPETGDLTWKQSRPGVRGGSVAGHVAITGYRYVGFGVGKKYMAHRIAWFLHYGTQPELIDHINRNKADNRIKNLRPATVAENALNQATTGVTWQWGKKTKLGTKRRYAMASYRHKNLYKGPNLLIAHYRRIMAERADHPIGLPAPV
jgi:hypothetical protein